MDALNFIFSLIDKVSGPARTMDHAIGALPKTLADVDRALKMVERDSKKLELDKLLGGGDHGAAQKALHNRMRALTLHRDLMGGASDGGSGITDTLANIAHAGQIAVGVLSAVGAVASTAFDVGRSVIEVGAAGANYVLQAAQFRENTLVGLQTILHSQDAAQRVFSMAQRFAQKTPFETNEVIAGISNLVTAGFHENELPAVFGAVADIAAVKGRDKMEPIITALARIRGAGRMTSEVMESLRGAGLGEALVYPAIAKYLNIQGTGAVLMARVQKAIEDKKVTDGVAINAILNSVRTLTGHDLGGAAVAASDTLTGIISNLQSAPSDLLSHIDLANLPGISTLKNALKAVTGLFDVSSASGQRMVNIVSSLTNGVFGTLFGDLSTPEAANNAVEGILRNLEEIAPTAAVAVGAFKEFGGGFLEGLRMSLRDISGLTRGIGGDAQGSVGPIRELGIQIGDFAEKIRMLWSFLEGVTSVFQKIGDFFSLGLADMVGEQLGESVFQRFSGRGYVSTSQRGVPASGERLVNGILQGAAADGSVSMPTVPGLGTLLGSMDADTYARMTRTGRYAVEGFNIGMRDGLPEVHETAAALVSTAENAVRSTADMHSPSRLFAQLGWYMSAGMADGIESGLPNVRASLAGMVDAGTPSRGGSGGGASLGGVSTGDIHVHVGGGAHGDDHDALASAIADKLGALFNTLRRGDAPGTAS